MSVRKDGKIIAGTTINPDLFDWKWADHILDNASWLRADTFSWQSGAVYQAAYAHLVLDIDGKTLQSETVGNTTIQFYLADDGHKICPASEEANAVAIYAATGVAWYYIVDTVNERFKLPRANKDSFGPLLNYAGRSNFSSGNTAPDDGWVMWNNSGTGNATVDGVTVYIGGNDSSNEGPAVIPVKKGSVVTVTPDAGTTSFVPYIKNKTTNQYKHLYFYVGNFTPTALQNTAGINTELFNGKLDQDFSNATADIASSLNNVGVRTIVETYESGNDWYRKYSDGWVEQGSNAHNRGSSNRWNFLVGMAGTYNAQITARGSQRYAWVTDMGSTYLTFNAADDSSQNNDGLYYIKVCGYAAS